MSDSAIELAQRAFERYRARDFAALAQILDPEIVAVLAVPLGAKHVYPARRGLVSSAHRPRRRHLHERQRRRDTEREPAAVDSVERDPALERCEAFAQDEQGG